MVPDSPPTAEGELAQTPFSHLVVFALDKRLTGEMFLRDPSGTTHALRFVDGVPVKLRVSDDFARLGDLLCDEGRVAREVVEAAVMTGGLLGDVLVLAGKAESPDVERLLASQFRNRVLRCYSLPPETTYRYFDGATSLLEWGGDPMSFDPLELLWSGLSQHAELSVLMQSTLNLLGDTPLKIHPAAPVHRFGLDEDGETVVELLLLEPMPLSDLLLLESPSKEIVSRVVYALAISRQLDLGKGGLPVGVDPASVNPQSVARVRLRSQAIRQGAAVDSDARPLRSITLRGKAIIPREEVDTPPAELAEPAAVDIAPVLPILGDEEAVSSKPIPVATAPVAAEVPAEVPPADELPGASIVDEPSGGEESSRRLIADAVRGLSHAALLQLAKERLDEHDPSTAAEIYGLGRERLIEDGKPNCREANELAALQAWANALEPHAELKALLIDLDTIIRQKDDCATVRLVRGRIRKKLGDNPGTLSDLRRVLELDPNNEEAISESKNLSVPPATPPAAESGFLKRLFRR